MNINSFNMAFDKTISALVKSILTIDEELLEDSDDELVLEEMKRRHRKSIYHCMDRFKDNFALDID